MSTKKSVNKVVLAYSGGLDTSCIVPWLVENYGCEVVCFCANLGQEEELSGLEAKALASGASKLYIEDLREEFITDYIYPTMMAGAIYEREYLLGTSFARPLIAKRMVEIAELEGADAVSHGATGKGNDQVRFELTVMALNPKLKIIAPWREWHIRSREDALKYCAEHNVPVTATIKSIYSRDRNLWHLSHEGGILEDPWQEPEEVMYQLSVSPEAAPDVAEYVEIHFEQGAPKRVNGVAMGPIDLVATLNTIGARHGVGRIDLVENRLVGMKSHGVYETPGGTLLYRGARGAGADLPGQAKPPVQADDRIEIRRADLQRPVVHPDPRGAGCVRGRHAAQRHGRRPAEAVQGQHHAGRPQVAAQPLPRGLRHVRRGRCLQPEGRRGLHQAVRPADEGIRHAGHRGQRSEQVSAAGLFGV